MMSAAALFIRRKRETQLISFLLSNFVTFFQDLYRFNYRQQEGLIWEIEEAKKSSRDREREK